jgi:nicotinate phosphoribosyltransferase
VYKLVEDVSGPKIKLAPHKTTAPGRKQVYRVEDASDPHDVVALEEEQPPDGGRPLLEHVIAGGRRVRAQEPLAAIRARRAATVARLPERLRRLELVEYPYPVRLSAGLTALIERLCRG